MQRQECKDFGKPRRAPLPCAGRLRGHRWPGSGSLGNSRADQLASEAVVVGVFEDLGLPLDREEEDLGVPIDRESYPADGASAAAAECVGREDALPRPGQGDGGAGREHGGGSYASLGRQIAPRGTDGAIAAGGARSEAFVRARLPSSKGGGGEGRVSLQKKKRRKKGSDDPSPGPTASGASLSLQLQDIMGLVKKKK